MFSLRVLLLGCAVALVAVSQPVHAATCSSAYLDVGTCMAGRNPLSPGNMCVWDYSVNVCGEAPYCPQQNTVDLCASSYQTCRWSGTFCSNSAPTCSGFALANCPSPSTLNQDGTQSCEVVAGACVNYVAPPAASSSSGAAAPAAFVGSARCYTKTTSADCRQYVITRCCVSLLLCCIAVFSLFLLHRCFH